MYWKGGQVNKTQKCHIGRLTETLAAQLATALQVLLDGDEEFVWPELPPTSNAFFIVAAKLSFAVYRRD